MYHRAPGAPRGFQISLGQNRTLNNTAHTRQLETVSRLGDRGRYKGREKKMKGKRVKEGECRMNKENKLEKIERNSQRSEKSA